MDELAGRREAVGSVGKRVERKGRRIREREEGQDRARYSRLETACGIPGEQFRLVCGHNASRHPARKAIIIIGVGVVPFCSIMPPVEFQEDP